MRTDRQIDMTKLIVAFSNSANKPKKSEIFITTIVRNSNIATHFLARNSDL
jgi:hypothetical protein